MRRRLFAVASAVSLLLFVGIGLLWPRSFWYQDTVYYVGQNWSAISICSHWGSVSFGTRRITGMGDPSHEWHFYSGRASSISMGVPHHTFLGFATSGLANTVQTAFGNYQFEDRYFTMPFWFIMICFAALPLFYAAAALRYRRWKNRLAEGLCPACGYDLVGNTSGICPECGTPVPKAVADRSPRPA